MVNIEFSASFILVYAATLASVIVASPGAASLHLPIVASVFHTAAKIFGVLAKIFGPTAVGKALLRAILARVFSVIPKLLAALRAACPSIRRGNSALKRAMGFGLVDELLAARRAGFTVNRFRVMGATNRAILPISRHGSSYCEGLPALGAGQGDNPVGVLAIPATEVLFGQLVLAFRLPKNLAAVIAGNIYKAHCCLSLIRDLDFYGIGRPGIKEPGFSEWLAKPFLATCILA